MGLIGYLWTNTMSWRSHPGIIYIVLNADAGYHDVVRVTFGARNVRVTAERIWLPFQMTAAALKRPHADSFSDTFE
jgi:hypothetical protein